MAVSNFIEQVVGDYSPTLLDFDDSLFSAIPSDQDVFTTFQASQPMYRQVSVAKPVIQPTFDQLDFSTKPVYRTTQSEFGLHQLEDYQAPSQYFKDDNYPIQLDWQQPQETPQVNESLIQNIINEGRKQLGKPYLSGTHGPKSFDCSGLMHHIFKSNGVDLPLNIFKQVKYGKSIALKDARPGDIIVTPGKGRSGLHVKLITDIKDGNITVLEAKGKKWGVVEGPLTNTNNIISVQRIIDNIQQGSTPTSSRTPSGGRLADRVVETARSQIGGKYTSSGKSPETGFDCSGLVYWAYKQNGITIPRSTVGVENHKQGIIRSVQDIRKGDVIVTPGGGPNKRHEVIAEADYNPSTQSVSVISASNPKKGIVRRTLTPSSTVYAIRRFIENAKKGTKLIPRKNHAFL